jgi:putative ABC transport system permease protein
MPAGFDFPSKAQAWTPQVVRIQGGNSLMFPVIGRLKPDITAAQAHAQFDAISRQLPQPPEPDRGGAWNVGLFPLKDYVVGKIRRPLLTFAAAVAIVLLIACANVTNLLLARASGRQREMAVRAALGASRRRLIRQLLTESVVLSLAGGALGIALSRWAVSGLLALAPDGRIPRVEMIRVDGWVLTFALGASLLTAMLFGLAPAVTLSRRRFAGTLLPGGRTFGAGQERLRAALVVAEIALALMLVTGAGLLVKSFMRLRAVDSGFDTRNVVALNVELPASVYGSAEKLHVFHLGASRGRQCGRGELDAARRHAHARRLCGRGRCEAIGSRRGEAHGERRLLPRDGDSPRPGQGLRRARHGRWRTRRHRQPRRREDHRSF